jgi:hypothetical protein
MELAPSYRKYILDELPVPYVLRLLINKWLNFKLVFFFIS